MDHSIEIAGAIVFAVAVLHTFSVKRFEHLAHQFRSGSVRQRFFHLMGEVEVVFGLWAGLFLAIMTVMVSFDAATAYLESLNFTEPAFVFTIMTIAATRPVVHAATVLILKLSRFLPLSRGVAFYLTILTVGPLLGSFITEPAAMTVTALILRDNFYNREGPKKFFYMTLGVLLVNISIGGVLTHFAAPPVLMVASTWNWDTPFMFAHFGWKAAIAVVANALILTYVFRDHLRNLQITASTKPDSRAPLWLVAMHLGFLAVVVFTSHHPLVFFGFFLFFIGLTTVSQEHQEQLKLKESLLVAFFLAGLVVLGSMQRWWIEPILLNLAEVPLFVGTTFLTGVMDNAALTYLGAQVPNLGEGLKYALVAGAVAGGGLTVIANAPNPAGFTILRPKFGDEGISPMGLFLSALPFTAIAMACFWFLP